LDLVTLIEGVAVGSIWPGLLSCADAISTAQIAKAIVDANAKRGLMPEESGIGIEMVLPGNIVLLAGVSSETR